MIKKLSILFLKYGVGLVAFWLIFFEYTNVYATTTYGVSCTVTTKVVGTAYVEILKTNTVLFESSLLGDCSFVKKGDIFVVSVNNSKNSGYIKVGDTLEAGLEKWTATGPGGVVGGIDWKPVSIIYSNRKLPEGFSLGSRLEPEKSTPKTIEDAVRASGGTYGVINTKDPDAGKNFVDTVFDQGLTYSDRNGTNRNGNCVDSALRSGVKISCGLNTDGTAAYFYDGKRGEKITVTVLMRNYLPTIAIDDANGGIFSADTHTIKNTPFTITKTLPYSGKYTFEIYTGEFVQNKDVLQPFTILLTSDKTNLQPDVRKDSLVEGKKYSVSGLNDNMATTSRKFKVSAYVNSIYEEPYCPKGANCKISMMPNITICDLGFDTLNTIDRPSDPKGFDKLFATVFTKKYFKKGDLEIGNKKYTFEISVMNTSNTNVPNNRFELISINGKVIPASVASSGGGQIQVKIKTKDFLTTSSHGSLIFLVLDLNRQNGNYK